MRANVEPSRARASAVARFNCSRYQSRRARKANEDYFEGVNDFEREESAAAYGGDDRDFVPFAHARASLVADGDVV